MTYDLEGRSILITGASAGIGAELAVAVSRRGARVTLAARRREALEAVAVRCIDVGGQAEVVPTDVADPEACRALADAAVARFGGIDVVVNNAGITMYGRFEDVTDLSVYERLMQVNYLGAVYVTHAALGAIKRSGGLLVAVSSLTGLTGVPTRTGYAASKHAMRGFFESLRIELLGTSVDVLVVSPGFVDTGIRASAMTGTGGRAYEGPAAHRGRVMSVDYVVGEIVGAMERRSRDLVLPRRLRSLVMLKGITPRLIDRIAARVIGKESNDT